MRYNFSPSLWILIYVIFGRPYKRFNCSDICKNPDLKRYENVIFENDSYRYSLHYNYSMRILRNQPQPVPSERFINMINDKYVANAQFSFSFYGYRLEKIRFHEYPTDHVYKFGRSQVGNIINHIKNYTKSESRVLDEKELFGVKRNFSINVNGTEVTATMTTLIHTNGKISFYYDNIPMEIEESQLQSKIVGSIRCEGEDTEEREIRVPVDWIKSGTLVEFEAIGEICSQYNTSETCQRSTTLKTTCIWCEKGEKCIESNNPDTHGLKVNDCRVETTKTTDENKQHKSHWYLYVVIPLVASLFLICIGCIIWRWLLRRKRSDE
uniref:Egg protein CP391S-like protein n=1 Tax=Schistosoma mansoni TaxID=6183 RepID=A0AA82N806_SCHMA